MKCDKLKSVYIDRTGDWVRSETNTGKFYLKEEVDTVIAGLEAKLESAQASMYCDVVDANMDNRRLKRALYNLRACYADMMQKRYIECKTDGWVHRVNKWIEVERRCLKKAEEYK